MALVVVLPGFGSACRTGAAYPSRTAAVNRHASMADRLAPPDRRLVDTAGRFR